MTVISKSWAPMLALLFAFGCSDGGGGGEAPDTGFDATDAASIEVELGPRTEQVFAPMQPGDTLEVVSGFQGGFHIEPAVRMSDPGAEDFITVIEYTVTEVDTGTVLSADPSTVRIQASAWDHRPGIGYVRTWERIILNINDPDSVAGETVRIDTRVIVEHPYSVGTDSVTVDLVNEVDELG